MQPMNIDLDSDAPVAIRRDVRLLLAMTSILLLIVAAACAGLLVFATASVNRLQERQESALVERTLQRWTGKIASDLTTATVWDQAYRQFRPGGDTAWADAEIGSFFVNNRGVDLAYAVDAHGRAFYAFGSQGQLEPASLGDFSAAVFTLQRALTAKAQATQAMLPDAPPTAPELASTLSTVLTWRGDLYFVSGSTVVPEDAVSARAARQTVALFTAVKVRDGFLADLRNDLHLRDVRLVPPGPRSLVTLKDYRGRAVAGLSWTSERPGIKVLHDSALAIGAVLSAILAVGLALVLRIGRIARRVTRSEADLHLALEDTVRAQMTAEAANRSKSEFLANMSHEIRTPLNGVLGMLQVVERSKLPSEQRQRIAVARESGETLLRLLNDLLDLSKIEAGHLSIETRDFDLEHLLEITCRNFADVAAQKDLTLDCVIEPQACGSWSGDDIRLRQVITNLVSNALKFTKAGGVEVNVRVLAHGVRFTVADTGIGMSAESLERVFDSFVQADASTTRVYGGTGLGLAISRRLVQAMGGDLYVKSWEGQGSCFWFDLPLSRGVPSALTAAPVEASVQAARILAVDDNRTNRILLQALLEPLGVDLALAANGLEAVQATAARDFDLILMDVQMPVMDGVTACREIRSRDARLGRRRVPILALTANVMPRQIASYAEAGMDGHVAKPFTAEALVAALIHHLAGDAAGDAERAAAPVEP